MVEESTLLRAMSALDPVRDEPPETDSERLLTEIRSRIAADESAHHPADVVPRPIPRRTRRIMAGAAAAALVAVGVVTITQQQDPPVAFAGWTATPTELSPAEAGEMDPICSAPLPGADGLPDPEAPELEPVLTEARGDYRMQLSTAGSQAYATCFSFPGEDTIRETATLGAGDALATPEAGEVTLVEVASWRPLPDHGPVTFAFGRVGSDVVDVSLATTTDSFAEASVANGWWLVWFPTEVELDDTLTVTTEDGTEQTVVASAGPNEGG